MGLAKDSIAPFFRKLNKEWKNENNKLFIDVSNSDVDDINKVNRVIPKIDRK